MTISNCNNTITLSDDDSRWLHFCDCLEIYLTSFSEERIRSLFNEYMLHSNNEVRSLDQICWDRWEMSYESFKVQVFNDLDRVSRWNARMSRAGGALLGDHSSGCWFINNFIIIHSFKIGYENGEFRTPLIKQMLQSHDLIPPD